MQKSVFGSELGQMKFPFNCSHSPSFGPLSEFPTWQSISHFMLLFSYLQNENNESFYDSSTRLEKWLFI